MQRSSMLGRRVMPPNQTLHWTGATTVLVIQTLVVSPGQ